MQRLIPLASVLASLLLAGCSPARIEGCSLLQFHGDLVAEDGRPVLLPLGDWGTSTAVVPLDWPDDWTIRPADGGQFEILDRDGAVQVRTGTRVVLLAPGEPGGPTYTGGDFTVCAADPYPADGEEEDAS